VPRSNGHCWLDSPWLLSRLSYALDGCTSDLSYFIFKRRPPAARAPVLARFSSFLACTTRHRIHFPTPAYRRSLRIELTFIAFHSILRWSCTLAAVRTHQHRPWLSWSVTRYSVRLQHCISRLAPLGSLRPYIRVHTYMHPYTANPAGGSHSPQVSRSLSLLTFLCGCHEFAQFICVILLHNILHMVIFVSRDIKVSWLSFMCYLYHSFRPKLPDSDLSKFIFMYTLKLTVYPLCLNICKSRQIQVGNLEWMKCFLSAHKVFDFLSSPVLVRDHWGAT
jgi:hypothetical protein